MQGAAADHIALRARVARHIAAHPDAFSPFVEDDEPFEKYCSRMVRDGTWAGHLEIQAASLLLGVNIAVYQGGQPCWRINNFPEVGAGELQGGRATL